MDVPKVSPLPQIAGEETLTGFQAKVDSAKLAGIDFVETSPAIFNYFTHGQQTSFFWYQNIKVFKYGEREAIEAFDRLPLEKRAEAMIKREAGKAT
jgi:hypothetical protein